MNLQPLLKKNEYRGTGESRPLIFDLSKTADCRNAKTLLQQKKPAVHDTYTEQLKEYFLIKNPSLLGNQKLHEKSLSYVAACSQKTPLWQQGRWIYFPWINSLVHILEEKSFFELRTSRNKNLINKEEQKQFAEAVVGIAGLSVGGGIALALALQGGGNRMNLADYDTLELTNTNRIRTGIQNLGLPKAVLVAREIYMQNPYAKINIFDKGLTAQNIKKFFSGLDIVIDEMDNLAMKYKIREEASRRKIPVLMGADNGDGIVVDIERYDQNPKTKFFHGRMGKVSFASLTDLDKAEIGRKITRHIGIENISVRMQSSLLQIGKSLASWPQLGGAALLNGAAIAFCVRKIALGEPLVSNRAVFSFDEKFRPNYNKKRDKQADQEFKKIYYRNDSK